MSGREAKNDLVIDTVSPLGLHVTRPTAKYLLAMKIMACRKPLPGYEGDFKDIEVLLRVTKLRSVAALQELIDAFFPDTVLTDSVRDVLEDILDRISNER